MQRLAWLLSISIAPAVAQTVHINSVHGAVSVRQDGAPARPAAADTLAISETTISTGPHSSASIDFDWAHSLQLNPNTEFRLVRLDPAEYRTEIVHGSLLWWVAGDSPARALVKTPNVTVLPREPGSYQIGINARGESEVTAWAGAVEVTAPRGSEWVNAGQKMVARGSPADPEFRMMSAISRWKRAAALIAGALQAVNVAADVMSSPGGKDRETKGRPAGPPSHSPHAPSAPAPAPPTHGTPGPPAHGTPSAPASHSSPAPSPASHK